jgi:hypothetical protein
MGSGGVAPPFLNLELGGGEWWASRSDHFIPGERDPPPVPIGYEAGLLEVKQYI